MTGLNAEKTEKTDETNRIDEANRIDETDRIDELEKIDETDRPDLTGIRSRSALRFSNLLVRARGLFRFFGFDDPASGHPGSQYSDAAKGEAGHGRPDFQWRAVN